MRTLPSMGPAMFNRERPSMRDRALDEAKAIIADCWLNANLSLQPDYPWLARFLNGGYDRPLINDGLEDVA